MENKVRSGLAIAGFVLSLVSIILFWIPVFGLILALLALVFSIIGLINSEKKGLAIAGLVISGIFTLLALLITMAILGGVNETENSAKEVGSYPCPNLSSMKLLPYDGLVQSWGAQVSFNRSGNLEVIYTDLRTSDIYGRANIIYCAAGEEEGQNANWVYCGDFIRPIIAQYTDSSGNILKKRSVEVIFDKNTKQYLSTKCDTYTLM